MQERRCTLEDSLGDAEAVTDRWRERGRVTGEEDKDGRLTA